MAGNPYAFQDYFGGAQQPDQMAGMGGVPQQQPMQPMEPMGGPGLGYGGAQPQPGLRDPTRDPAFVAAMLRQQTGGMKAKLGQQQKLADMLRQGAAGQLQGVNTGGRGGYVAPGIANLLASVFANYKAGRQEAGAASTAAEMDAATQKQNEDWFTRLGR